MQAVTVPTLAFADQKPGTSGLRKKVTVFAQTHYLENFIQSLFDALGPNKNTLVVGGDGRYYNDVAIQTIIRMAAANGVQRLIIGREGLLSTPAASALIRKYQTDGGIVLSASHNPAGTNGDFGIKFNTSNGAPAAESVTDAVYRISRSIQRYFIVQSDAVELSELGETTLGKMRIQIVDPVSNYAKLMESMFDFDAIRELFRGGFRMRFDAMHAITGPYAKAILEQSLGASAGTVINGKPLPDFGGGHPDPNLTYAKSLVDMLYAENGPDFGAASDGDGDRNLILGHDFFVTPSDSLAVMAAQAECIPAFAGGLKGVARSMPTSRAVDAVARAKDLECFETPTGWKFFCNLMDAGRVRLCGEESFGTGSDHVREKDGLWAVLCWLNILAVRKTSVASLVRRHWMQYGRHYYSRHDFEEIDNNAAGRIVDRFSSALPRLAGQKLGDEKIITADEFAYTDPIDQSKSLHQGIRIITGTSRLIVRLSGTGTQGATLRLYMEKYEAEKLDLPTQDVLHDLIAYADSLGQIKALSGKAAPDVIT